MSTLHDGVMAERQRWLMVVGRRIDQHATNLAGWQEPGGFLLPTEPDPEERALIRTRLEAAIEELRLLVRELGLGHVLSVVDS